MNTISKNRYSSHQIDLNTVLKQEMLNHGIECFEHIPEDGKIHRFHIVGDKKYSKNGWAVLHDDPPAGAFGCWKRNICQTLDLSSHLVSKPFMPNKSYFKNKQPADSSLQKAHAISLWHQASIATDGCKYLRTKKIKSHGLRYYQNALLIPVKDVDGNLHGVQRIWPDGTKKFMSGTDKKGHLYQLGTIVSNTILIAEGYATAATLHEITGHCVVVAFDADNLQPVAEALHSTYPVVKFILCADDDWKGPGNPGLTKATEAAEKINAVVVSPVFLGDRLEADTDFNDLFIRDGKEAVKNCLPLTEGYNV